MVKQKATLIGVRVDVLERNQSWSDNVRRLHLDIPEIKHEMVSGQVALEYLYLIIRFMDMNPLEEFIVRDHGIKRVDTTIVSMVIFLLMIVQGKVAFEVLIATFKATSKR